MKFHHSDHAPAAIGPYSQAVAVDGFLYTSGQVALDAQTGELVGDDFATQAKKVLSNLEAVLASAGCGFSDVVRTTVYLTDFGDFQTLNSLYGDVMGDHRPARSTVQVAGLPLGARLEIDMIAKLP